MSGEVLSERARDLMADEDVYYAASSAGEHLRHPVRVSRLLAVGEERPVTTFHDE